jgi:hypothetical protein
VVDKETKKVEKERAEESAEGDTEKIFEERIEETRRWWAKGCGWRDKMDKENRSQERDD